MSQTTPDVSQLCPHCGSEITWTKHQEEGEDPLYAGHCHYCGWELLDVSEPVRELEPGEARLLPRIAELEAANAELMATLANERGEGEAPVEGWRWIPHIRAWQVDRDGKPWADVFRDGVRWYWRHWVPTSCELGGNEDTARDAMRAASSQGADVPKGQP